MNDVKQLAQTMLVKIARDAVKRVLVKKAYGTGAPTVGGMPAVKDWSSKGSMKGVKALSTSPTGALNKQAFFGGSPSWQGFKGVANEVAGKPLRAAWNASTQFLSGLGGPRPTPQSETVSAQPQSTPKPTTASAPPAPVVPRAQLPSHGQRLLGGYDPVSNTTTHLGRGPLRKPSIGEQAVAPPVRLPDQQWSSVNRGSPTKPTSATHAAPQVDSQWDPANRQTSTPTPPPRNNLVTEPNAAPPKAAPPPTSTGTRVGRNSAGKDVWWDSSKGAAIGDYKKQMGVVDPTISFTRKGGKPESMPLQSFYDIGRNAGTNEENFAAASRLNETPANERDADWINRSRAIQNSINNRQLFSAYQQAFDAYGGKVNIPVNTAVRDHQRANGVGIHQIGGTYEGPEGRARRNQDMLWAQQGQKALQDLWGGQKEAPSQYQIAQTAYKMSGPATGQMSPEQRAAMLGNVSQQSTLRGSGLRSRV